MATVFNQYRRGAKCIVIRRFAGRQSPMGPGGCGCRNSRRPAEG